MWELDYKEIWALKNWCFWTVVLEKTLESPLDFKENQPVHPKGDESWVFIGRTHLEAETPILWPSDVKSWLIGKDLDTGKDWGQEEKGTTEDEMVGWHHQLNAHGSGWTLGVCDGQGGLVCCGSWDRKESDTIERLNWNLFSSFFSIPSNILIKTLLYYHVHLHFGKIVNSWESNYKSKGYTYLRFSNHISNCPLERLQKLILFWQLYHFILANIIV